MELSPIDLIIAAPLTLSQAVPISFLDPHGIPTPTPATQKWLAQAVRHFIAYAGDIAITAVTPRMIHQWQQSEMKRNITPTTLNSYLRALKTFYGRLQKNNTIGHNPAGPVKYLPEPPPKVKRIPESDYLALLAATDGTETATSETSVQAIRDRAILSTLWGTGCRLKELVGMNLRDVEPLTNGRQRGYAIYITGKKNKPRWVYLKEEPAELFTNWLAARPTTKDPAVFLSNRSARIAPHTIHSIIRRLRETAVLPPTSHTNPHAFRHAFAIRKLEQGYDLPLVSAWLGHSSAEFTASVYVIRSENDLRRCFFSPPPQTQNSTV